MIAKAIEFKLQGNRNFQEKPPDTDKAITAYNNALDGLPACSKSSEADISKKPERISSSGIEEITDEEAAVIENTPEEETDPEETRRKELEEQLRDCTKACWGNLGACHLAQVSLAACSASG